MESWVRSLIGKRLEMPGVSGAPSQSVEVVDVMEGLNESSPYHLRVRYPNNRVGPITLHDVITDRTERYTKKALQEQFPIGSVVRQTYDPSKGDVRVTGYYQGYRPGVPWKVEGVYVNSGREEIFHPDILVPPTVTRAADIASMRKAAPRGLPGLNADVESKIAEALSGEKGSVEQIMRKLRERSGRGRRKTAHKKKRITRKTRKSNR